MPGCIAGLFACVYRDGEVHTIEAWYNIAMKQYKHGMTGTHKARSGVFDEGAHDLLAQVNSSLAIDSFLARYDLLGSIAHAKMLGKTGIVSAKDSAKLVKGLNSILKDLDAGTLELPAEEDIHMAMEAALSDRIGAVAGKLHVARSRNDQVALDMQLFIIDASGKIVEEIGDLLETLARRAQKHIATVMPAYTHLQRAQPVLFSHHLMAYAFMFERDAARFESVRKNARKCPLGAGACTGTTFPIDREFVARELGFDSVTENSLDAVSSRDSHLEFLFAASVLQTHLSRLAEELILWSSHEFGFVRFSDKVTTGSSIMPQKRNLDGAELIRGKAGRAAGNLMSLLTAVKGLPMAYNKDLQEDKEPLLSGYRTAKDSAKLMTLMLEEMTIDDVAMRKATEAPGSFLLATELADYLASKGMAFREAHHLVGEAVKEATLLGVGLENFTPEDFARLSSLIEGDVYSWLNVDNAIERRSVPGGTSKSSVRAQIRTIRRRINALRKTRN
ncbi:MAG: argininosuccinate lyase [Planctomycetes bacterium]|nr:argininosuccinate lyase [Planctomycetota bacterium]